MKRIKQLEAALGRKTLENDILKEAVDFAKAKNGLRARRCCPGTTDETGLFDPWRGAQSSRGTAQAS
jgi:transposase